MRENCIERGILGCHASVGDYLCISWFQECVFEGCHWLVSFPDTYCCEYSAWYACRLDTQLILCRRLCTDAKIIREFCYIQLNICPVLGFRIKIYLIILHHHYSIKQTMQVLPFIQWLFNRLKAQKYEKKLIVGLPYKYKHVTNVRSQRHQGCYNDLCIFYVSSC